MTARPDGTGPSRSVIVLGPLSRRINRYVVRVAGRRRAGPLARVHHVGRRSGRSYSRPVLARPAGGHVLIPLFFGAEADWCRNVQAAQGCRLEIRGRDHRLTDPRVVPSGDLGPLVDAAFTAPERAFLRAAGITEYLLLDDPTRAAR